LIEKGPLPENALLLKYQRSGDFTDCYSTRLPVAVSHADYVAAFYTSWLFRLERLILRWAVARPSTDVEARQVADGDIDRFAAWTVEERAENQLLMCDFQNRTRSWFMVSGQRLYFGSAVVASRGSSTDKPSMGFAFRALIGFHRLYSRALLYCAKSRLQSLASRASRGEQA
jgi:hypothetical protein